LAIGLSWRSGQPDREVVVASEGDRTWDAAG
jgi:hypothetical protein